MRIVGDDGTVIETIFPTEKYRTYLKTFSIKTEEKLNADTIARLFLILRSDFLEGRLDLDEFANICNRLWTIMTKRNMHEDHHQLSEVLNAGGELSFYVRKIKLLHLFNDFLTKIFEFEDSSDLRIN